MRLRFVVSLLFGALIAAGGSQAQSLKTERDSSDNPADKAFLGAMRDMMIGLHRNMPMGDTDRDFARMMVPQHESAVDMAKAELQYGKDPELKALAQTVVTNGERETALFKAWQDRHPQ